MTPVGHDDEGEVNVEVPPVRYRLPEATRLILGDNHGLRHPQRWVAKQLRSGRFRGQKIGRHWFMRAVDIEAALESMNNVPTPTQEPEAAPDPLPEPEPRRPNPVLAGLSERGRRRMIR